MRHLPGLVEEGSPVYLRLSRGQGETSGQLFCELVQAARFGRSFRISDQACRVGRYVLGDEESPASYYAEKGRYQSSEAARRAAEGLPRLKKGYASLGSGILRRLWKKYRRHWDEGLC